jgi:para-aminobenzoate synthetase component 1
MGIVVEVRASVTGPGLGFVTYRRQPYMLAAMRLKAPVFSEIVYAEPFQMARRLAGERALTLLESAQRHEHLGRYSFLAVNPSQTLEVRNGATFLDGKRRTEKPLDLMGRLVRRARRANVAGLPPFQGGWAGYVSYDLGRQLEPKARIPAFPPICPDMIMHRFDTVIAIDHLQELAWVIGPDNTSIRRMEALLKHRPKPLGAAVRVDFLPVVSRAAHESNVRRTVDYILAGDIFQANITQALEAKMPDGFDCLAAYRQVCERNPAPFAALLDYDGLTVISSSPERLIRSDGRTAQARPIKGTRKRDHNPARDAALIAELQASRKDRAENVMIVDLLRNDLSRVSKPGSVKVPVLCGLESYANVHHLVSVVESELREGLGSADLFRAVFPGGSITGAPKIRAMEVIAELEGRPRGIYCGSIGYFGFNGACDFNIAIRTLQVAGGVMRLQGGGGITARSDAAAEHDESLVKVERIREAFRP